MKYTIYVKRPKSGDLSNKVNEMAYVLSRGGNVHWGRGLVKAIIEPCHKDGTPAIEFGYVNILVKAPFMEYLRNKIKFRKFATIKEGWPRLIKPGKK